MYLIKQDAVRLYYQKLGVDSRERSTLHVTYSFILSECLLLLTGRGKLPNWINLPSDSIHGRPKSCR